MQIQVVNASNSKWYRNYIDSVFDVEINKSGSGFALIHTPRNEQIISEEKDSKRREELLERLKNLKTGSRLGVHGGDAIKITGENNKDFKTLLAREW